MSAPVTTTTNATPELWRRLLCMIYESLLLAAVLFVASFIFILAFRGTDSLFFRPAFQLYLLIMAGIYFIWFWTHGGQTLAMQTWKMRIVNADSTGNAVSAEGKGISLRQAVMRYLFAFIGITLFGCGILWALFDRDRQFLHDRLAGTQIVKAVRSE